MPDSPIPVLVASRNPGKVREIADLLPGDSRLSFHTLDELGISPQPGEEGVEIHETFAENAHAKAAFFHPLSDGWVLAEDSGLCMDALGGAPGVRSKRFSGRADLAGKELDRANNDALLRALKEVPGERRGAEFRCAVVLLAPDGRAETSGGVCRGRIRTRPGGGRGFGYDPLFVPEGFDRTMAELRPEEKHAISHRGRAFRKLAERLVGLT